jgi:predicted permease
MKLNKDHKIHFSQYLQKKPIRYIELYNELYDHYATGYEEGNQDFETSLASTDEQFTWELIHEINQKVPKKTQKSLNQTILSEFRSFWKWPQILASLLVLLLTFILFIQLHYKVSAYIVGSVLIPYILLLTGLILYPKFTKKKKYKSAYVDATSGTLILPVSLFNLSIFLPILIGEEGNKFDLWSAYPLVPTIILLLFLFSIHIGYKVYKTKVRLQFI